MQRIDFDQLMSVAAQAFAEHGFTGVGMREVSRQCGVSLPTLYYYFESKEKLFEAVSRDLYDKALAEIRASVDLDAPDDTPLESQLEALCARLFNLLTGNRTLFLLLRRDLIHGSQPGEKFRSRYQYEGLIEIIRRLLARRHDAATAARLAFTCAALIFGYCEFVVVSGDAARGSEDLLAALKLLTRNPGIS